MYSCRGEFSSAHQVVWCFENCWRPPTIVVCIISSCLPNAVLHFDGSRAAVRALDDIKEGTEVKFCVPVFSCLLRVLPCGDCILGGAPPGYFATFFGVFWIIRWCSALQMIDSLDNDTYVICLGFAGQITISYVELAASTTVRRKALRDQYYFDCDCIRCSRLVWIQKMLLLYLWECALCLFAAHGL